MGVIGNFVSRFGRSKKLRIWIYAAAVVGVILVAISGLFGQKKYAETYTSSEYRMQTEHKVSELLSKVEGVGRSEIVISYIDADSDGARISGVAVVCDGADDIRVKAGLTELLSVALGVSYNNISINKMCSDWEEKT